ncbi:MAG TPA: hypothetical protein VKI44_02760 [Acetobacteraceae bacterium]|nr:hypothetical protein [Acetobacteraceae bacterium]
MTAQLPAIPKPTRITTRVRAAHPVPALVAAAGKSGARNQLELLLTG